MSEPIIRLTYASRATFKTAQQGVESEVARILLQSRRNNPKHAIGGVLHVADGHFFQCLEGKRTRVNDTFSRIASDPRHQDVQILSLEPVTERMFGQWSMKYSAAEKNLDALLKRYGFESFDPFRFNQDMITEFLQACASNKDPMANVGDNQPVAANDSPRPWWKRLLKRG
ncbi:BLUF domain-containing protein [Aestuariicella sp. G3-2]|uniref:BLUF domain-containing protein n=1 Tax=Pseudomaricurvus albidus TaxID=2842452 RepID=UPI001C0E25F4|nr:BLUF domain-containing protein [Aestuariicella albida]MBU3068587.1 BLUF domain-containing protein [Aestuariicella albida]